jgi:osmoprotectant transport system substrate-binding protein
MKKPLILAVLALAIVFTGFDALRSLFGDAEPTNAAEQAGGPVLVVGSANFPENALLGEIYAGALTGAGFEVDTALNLGSREVLFPAMENGDVTVVPEYTGALLDYLAGDDAEPATGTEEQLGQLDDVLPSGLQLLEPSRAQDQETVTCTAEVVDRHSLSSLADLGPVSGELVMGGPPELAQRSGRFSLSGLQDVYGVEFAEFKPLDVAGPLTVAALQAGKVDCANLFSTQSAIEANGFVSLTDPKGLIESQAVVPLISDAAAIPAVTRTLDAVSGQLTTDNLKAMVARVEVDKHDPATVARDFLTEHGLD